MDCAKDKDREEWEKMAVYNESPDNNYDYVEAQIAEMTLASREWEREAAQYMRYSQPWREAIDKAAYYASKARMLAEYAD